VAQQFGHPGPGSLPDDRRQFRPPFVVADRDGVPEALEDVPATGTVPQMLLNHSPVCGSQLVVQVPREALERFETPVIVVCGWSSHDASS
jgi:hypothetical protein